MHILCVSCLWECAVYVFNTHTHSTLAHTHSHIRVHTFETISQLHSKIMRIMWIWTTAKPKSQHIKIRIKYSSNSRLPQQLTHTHAHTPIHGTGCIFNGLRAGMKKNHFVPHKFQMRSVSKTQRRRKENEVANEVPPKFEKKKCANAENHQNCDVFRSYIPICTFFISILAQHVAQSIMGLFT